MQTYWEHKGAYQSEYEALHKQLVPKEGKAATTHGELLRSISRIYYDWFNNGGCNLDNAHFQLALYTIRDWADKIDEQKVRSKRKFVGTREFIDHLLRYARALHGDGRAIGLDNEAEKSFELLVDKITRVVWGVEAANLELATQTEAKAVKQRALAEADRLAKDQNVTHHNLLQFTDGALPRHDWHEPDEQGIEATVTGDHLDNAMGDDPESTEYVVTLTNNLGLEVSVNLATLLAIATHRDRE